MDYSGDYSEVVETESTISPTAPIPAPLVQKYDEAIRKGDHAFITNFLTLYRHVPVPVLKLPPGRILEEANHESLLILHEKEAVELPDFILAFILQDPYYLHRRLDDTIIRLILRYDSYELYRQFRDAIIKRIRECPQCEFESDLHGKIQENMRKYLESG